MRESRLLRNVGGVLGFFPLLRIVWFACDGLFKSLPIRIGHSCR